MFRASFSLRRIHGPLEIKIFFFFLVWAHWPPPAAKMPWGFLSRKKGTGFIKY